MRTTWIFYFPLLSLTFHNKKMYFSGKKGCYSCGIAIVLKDKKKYTVAKSTLEHCTKNKYASQNNYRNDSINFIFIICISPPQDNILPITIGNMNSSTIGGSIYPFFWLIQHRFQVSLLGVSSTLGFPEVMISGERTQFLV